MTTPDFRAELERLLDLYEALGGNWTPHNYTDTWNDALTSARAALATPPSELPTVAMGDIAPDDLAYAEGFLAGCSYAASATPPPEPPTDDELMALAVAVFEDPYATDKDYARAVLERWGK